MPPKDCCPTELFALPSARAGPPPATSPVPSGQFALPASHAAEFLGTAGNRKLTDTTLPAGSRGVTYQITAIRSTRRGESGQFNVNFGVDGEVGKFAGAKLAA